MQVSILIIVVCLGVVMSWWQLCLIAHQVGVEIKTTLSTLCHTWGKWQLPWLTYTSPKSVIEQSLLNREQAVGRGRFYHRIIDQLKRVERLIHTISLLH